MRINYSLEDKEGELLMLISGKEYIAPIGSGVYFYTEAEDMEDELMGKVIHSIYSPHEDILDIYCEKIEL